ncbi:MAG: DPP IV N-terminal domain-containing protein [Bacteroidetes bacterium]|nr:DPP IV N-terminal domain-containing protein [Bacteroidota bacterium]
MLRRLSLLLPLAAVLSTATAQEKLKELTLKDAITRVWDYLPERLDGLQWIPGTKEYSYIKDDVLMRGSLGKMTDRSILTLDKLNAGLPKEAVLKSFPDITWDSATRFHFSSNDQLHAYDLGNGILTRIVDIDPKGERLDEHPRTHNVAYTLGEDLYIAVAGGVPVRVTTDGTDGVVNGRSVHREEYGITKGTFWSPQGDRLAFYRMDEGMVTPYFLEDISTKPSTFKKIRYPMAGQASHHVTLGVFDLAAKKTVFLKTAGAADDYLTNVSWSADGKYVFIIHLNRATDHQRLVQYDAATGEPVKTLIEEEDKKWLEPLHPVTSLENSTQFLYWSERDGYRHLYLYDRNGGSPTADRLPGKGFVRALTPGEWIVKEIIGLDEKGTTVFVEGTGRIDAKDPKGAMDTHLYRVDLGTGRVTQLTKEPGTHHGQLNTGGTHLIDTWSSLTVPGRTEVIDAVSGKVMKTLVAAKDPLAGTAVGTIEFLQVPGENGDLLNARLIKPRGFDSRRKYPVLVYVYGGPHAQLVTNSFLGGASLWMLHAAQRGYLVFTVDGHGSEDRGRAFEQAIHRQLGVTEVKDQLDGVAYLKGLPYVDGDRMAVHGWSFGGHMTTALLLRAPGTFKAGVAGGAVMDWRMYEVMYTERYMDTPQENPDGYTLTELPGKADALKDHLLLIHDTMDDTVLPEHAMTFLKACVDKGVQPDFFVYPGHPHNVRGKDRLHLYTKVLDYIDAQLGTGR